MPTHSRKRRRLGNARATVGGDDAARDAAARGLVSVAWRLRGPWSMAARLDTECADLPPESQADCFAVMEDDLSSRLARFEAPGLRRALFGMAHILGLGRIRPRRGIREATRRRGGRAHDCADNIFLFKYVVVACVEKP